MTIENNKIQSPNEFQFTHISRLDNAPAGKVFSLDNGELKKETRANTTNAYASIELIDGPPQFAEYLDNLKPSDCITYGIPATNETIISTQSKLKELKAKGINQDEHNHPYIARDREHFSWSKGPGIMMLDHDPAVGMQAHTKESFIESIVTAAPMLANSPMVWKPSSSSYIINQDTGEELAGLKGQRLYLFVEDAREIPRIGENLFNRLWLAGHGYIQLSSSGAMLERTIVDKAVWQPERLDFAGGAFCHSPLIQNRVPAEVINV
jgi:hypothetical protein